MIDHRQVQRIVLQPHAPAATDLVFLRAADGHQLRTVLASLVPHVTFSDVVDPAEPAVQVGLTAAGLRALGIDDRADEALPRAFSRGMRRAARRLGDASERGALSESDPERWAAPFGPDDPPVHAVVVLSTGSWRSGAEAVVDRAALLGDAAAAVAGCEVACWEGRHRGGEEPFGFRDGIVDPVIDGSGRPVAPGNGVWDAAAGRWRAVAPGEAVLGHPDERGTIAGHPAAALLERDGSYLVIRRLQQHRDRFETACRAIAEAVGGGATADSIAEQMVGRTRTGAVLRGGRAEPVEEGFLYRTGPDAAVHVPPSSHIRRANPRDDLEAADLMVPRHVLFRRGIPYGAPGEEEGLLFLAVCADISRQFEFVQRHWLQDGNRFGLGAEPDALTGRRAPSTALDAANERVSVMAADGSRSVHAGISSFVTTRGGEYVLLPSRAALRLLAGMAPR